MRIEIDGWKLNIKFSASHFIPFHGKCQRLHGHDYGVRLSIEGDQVENKMVVDFVELKSILRGIVDEIDHHVIIPSKSGYMDVQELEAKVIVSFQDKEYIFPREDVYYMNVEVTTAEEISLYLLEKFISKFKPGKNIKKITLCVDEGAGQGACSEKVINI